MKRFICFITVLTVCMCFGGCAQIGFLFEPFRQYISEKKAENLFEYTDEKLPSDDAESQTESGDVIQESEPEFTELVTDAYSYSIESGSMTYEYKIPQINIDSREIDGINREIYDGLYGIIEEEAVGENSLWCLGIDYEWTVNGDLLSLLIIETCDADITYYDVYNVSVSDGRKVSDSEVISASMTVKDYKTNVKQALGSMYLNMYGSANTEDTFFREQFDRTVSDDNINKCVPFLREDGDLWIAGNVYSLAGAEYYSYLIDLNNYLLADNYYEYID